MYTTQQEDFVIIVALGQSSYEFRDLISLKGPEVGWASELMSTPMQVCRDKHLITIRCPAFIPQSIQP